MKLNEMLLPEFDQEMALTRKTLERIPEDKFDWKPHEKSMPLGRLASILSLPILKLWMPMANGSASWTIWDSRLGYRDPSLLT